MNDYLNKPIILVIFGITGDLSQRKLLPALYHLVKHHQLPENIAIIGISRKKVPVSEVYDSLKLKIHGDDYDKAVVEQLHDATRMLQVDLDKNEDYARLLESLRVVSDELGPGVSRLYYLSIPSQAFVSVVHHLGETGHHEPFGQDGERPRLLVEKPFGYDVASAETLVKAADEHFGEQQTFRIDHYLAKETAQNILTFRFQNPLFQSIWNTRHIEMTEYVWLCAKHARVHNESWDYFKGMGDDDIQRFREEALTGHRPTWPLGKRAARARMGQTPLGNVNDSHAMFAEDDETGTVRRPERQLTRLQIIAMDTMQLAHNATLIEIKARYKELVKRFHPDANGGDRGAEERLKQVIKAYGVLRASGLLT